MPIHSAVPAPNPYLGAQAWGHQASQAADQAAPAAGEAPLPTEASHLQQQGEGDETLHSAVAHCSLIKGALRSPGEGAP